MGKCDAAAVPRLVAFVCLFVVCFLFICFPFSPLSLLVFFPFRLCLSSFACFFSYFFIALIFKMLAKMKGDLTIDLHSKSDLISCQCLYFMLSVCVCVCVCVCACVPQGSFPYFDCPFFVSSSCMISTKR